MTAQEKTLNQTTPPNATTARSGLRVAAGSLLLGGLIFLAGVSRPVVQTWAETWDDEAERIAIAQARSGQFRLGFVLMGLGFVVIGLAVGMWGRSVARLGTPQRAKLCGAAGAMAVAGGLAVGLNRVIQPFVDLDGAAANDGWVGAAGITALSIGFVVFGVLTWSGPAPKWAGVLLALTGIAGVLTIPAFYMFGAIGFGVVGLVNFRRSWTPQVA